MTAPLPGIFRLTIQTDRDPFQRRSDALLFNTEGTFQEIVSFYKTLKCLPTGGQLEIAGSIEDQYMISLVYTRPQRKRQHQHQLQ
jgi:hypothetical protein